MENLINYFIQVHLIMAAGYAVYHVLLRSQRWFTCNRFTLLSIPILAFIAPLLRVPTPSNAATELFRVNLPLVNISGSPAESAQFHWLEVLVIAYALVALFFLLRLLIQLTKISLMHLGERTDGSNISEIGGSSFSFFRRIYLNNNLDAESRQMILAHEKIHVRQWHSADVIWAEIVSAVLWINPATWLIKNELKQTHEFIADRETLRQFSEKEYLNTVLNTVFQTRSVQFVNPFNYSKSLKNRIDMMKMESQKIHRLRYAIALPLVLLIGVAVSCSDREEKEILLIEQEKTPSLDKQGSDEVYSIVDQMPEFPGGKEALFQHLGENIKYPEAAKTDSISGVVYVTFVIEKDGTIKDVSVARGIGSGCDAEAVRVISEMPNWSPGIHKGKAVPVAYNIPIRFSLEES